MNNLGKCPKCGEILTIVSVESVDGQGLRVKATPPWPLVSYSCPACHTIMSVGLDPKVITEQIANAVVSALKSENSKNAVAWSK